VSRKLVSIITGTYQRHELLLEAIENIRQQTYRPLEHVIVADGPDSDLKTEIEAAMLDELYGGPTAVPGAQLVPIRFAELGFWSSGLFTNSISAAPFMVAQLLARGDYQIWWADDERALVPDHIERLVDLLEQYDADFVYPKVEMTWPAPSTQRCVIGANPPRRGSFTHALYRRDALDKGMLFRTHVGSGTDADCLERMMSVPGVRWAFLPEVTFTHKVDK
jgi:glycosyltransferase involved in cell wall biosynthesis